MKIRYVKHENIDFKKWDKCIKRSINGSLYGYSWFLNIVSPDWDALVDDTYENVMPFTYRRIFGIKVLVQPYFASNLGVYSSSVLDPETVNKFIEAIPKEFKYIKINLNKYNKITLDNIFVTSDIHYELDLIRSYRLIWDQYNRQIKDSVSSAQKRIKIIPDLNSNDLILLYQKSKGRIRRIFYRRRRRTLKMIVSTAVRFRVGQVYGAYINNKLCAAAFFIYSHEKAILLLALTNVSPQEHALEAIIDEFIRLHAEQNLTLRFEFATRKKYGEMYTGFGGRKNRFMNVFQNRLPWFLKYIKV